MKSIKRLFICLFALLLLINTVYAEEDQEQVLTTGTDENTTIEVTNETNIETKENVLFELPIAIRA